MINVNGKELDVHGLAARAEARKRSGQYEGRLLALLDEDIEHEVEEHAFPMIQVVYDLQRVLEDYGGALEPPADLSSGEDSERKGRLKSFTRRVQTRFIRAVNEGYVQQQEKFNTFSTKAVDISYRQLCGAEGGVNLSEAAARRDVWMTQRPQWDDATVEAVAGRPEGKVVMIGIPGIAILDILHDDKRLMLAVDTCDTCAAEAQARLLPAFFHPRPLEILRETGYHAPDLVVMAFPECLTGGEIEACLRWASSRMREGGVLLLGLNRGWSEQLSSDDGFVRYWPESYLESVLRFHAFEVERWTAGERVFLKGELKA